RIDHPVVATDGWMDLSTSQGRGQDAYVRFGDQHGSTGAHPLLMVKETELVETNRRRIYLRFDLSQVSQNQIEAAELVLDIEPSGLGFSAMVPDSRFTVLGLPGNPDWSEEGLRWAESPSMEEGIPLGQFPIKRGQASGRVEFASSRLAEFLRNANSDLINLVIVRDTGELDRQGLVHAFASKEHPSAQAPTLRLKIP
ncbi:MAG: DNRLRE domain-containing protein, partial [Verrucomicrobiota bacterium]